jgi:8-oxo-dGTP pyrophosphatase MutT (NUDIX family)
MKQKILVAGFWQYKSKVLLVRRAPHEKYLPGRYEMPGGKVEPGEHLRVAMAREWPEETGLEGEPSHVCIPTYTGILGATQYTQFAFPMVSGATPEQIRLDPREHDHWVLVDRVGLDDLLMDENERDAVEMCLDLVEAQAYLF